MLLRVSSLKKINTQLSQLHWFFFLSLSHAFVCVCGACAYIVHGTRVYISLISAANVWTHNVGNGIHSILCAWSILPLIKLYIIEACAAKLLVFIHYFYACKIFFPRSLCSFCMSNGQQQQPKRAIARKRFNGDFSDR